MSKPFLFAAMTVMLALSGCKHYMTSDPLACDKLVDWNDRKACKEKSATEAKEWEKRQK